MAQKVDIYLNTRTKNLRDAAYSDLNARQPVRIPDLVFGEQIPYRLYFIDGKGGYESFSGDASFSPKLFVGDIGESSTGGTYTLSHDGNTTNQINHNDSASDIQTELEGLTSIGVGNVRVTGSFPVFTVEFIGSLANTDESQITGDGSGLTPDSSVKTFTDTEGGSGDNEVQVIQLVRDPIAAQESWSVTSDGNGFEARLDTSTKEFLNAVQTAKDGDPSKTYAQKFWSVKLDDGSSRTKVYAQAPVTIRHGVSVPAGSVNTLSVRRIYNTRSDLRAETALIHLTQLYDVIGWDGTTVAALGTGTYAYNSNSTKSDDGASVLKPDSKSAGESGRFEIIRT